MEFLYPGYCTSGCRLKIIQWKTTTDAQSFRIPLLVESRRLPGALVAKSTRPSLTWPVATSGAGMPARTFPAPIRRNGWDFVEIDRAQQNIDFTSDIAGDITDVFVNFVCRRDIAL
jgi:hypothetical protein